jgi:hypothetical protein
MVSLRSVSAAGETVIGKDHGAVFWRNQYGGNREVLARCVFDGSRGKSGGSPSSAFAETKNVKEWLRGWKHVDDRML